MKNFVRSAGLLLLAFGSSAVMALPISGNISFLGTSSVTGTTLSFTNATVALVDGNFVADGVAFGDVATFTDFDFGASPFPGVSSLWTIVAGDFTFNLETVMLGPTGPGVDLALAGTGTLVHPGSNDVVYSWGYSGNDISGTLQVFSSSSSPIPEPGSLALLGLGLVGFAVTGYKRRRTQV